MMRMLEGVFMCKKLFVFSTAFCLGVVFIQVIKQTNKDPQPLAEVSENISNNPQPTQPINSVKVFFENFQKAVAGNDKATVVSLLNFPIKATLIVDGRKPVIKTIKSANEFLSEYDKIFDDSLKKSISQTEFELFSYSTSCKVSSLRSGVEMKIFGISDIMEIFKRKDLNIKVVKLGRESYLAKKRNGSN